jgi:hypothetical protein
MALTLRRGRLPCTLKRPSPDWELREPRSDTLFPKHQRSMVIPGLAGMHVQPIVLDKFSFEFLISGFELFLRNLKLET